MIEAERTPIEAVIESLKQSPEDAKALQLFVTKIRRTVGSMTRTEPEKAEKLLADAKAAFDAAAEAVKSDETKKIYDQQKRIFVSLEREIESGKKLLAVIGKDAIPLNVETWVNGDPIATDELKGKVVLLDFWAIWCGPCIVTFPHLREWHEKYSDKGLVIVGLTKYYNYEWKGDAERPTRATEELPHEQELEMLKKFAEHHKLHHRFAIQVDNSMAEFYAVTGIPHVVVIDQTGKVRMIRVGSGAANAKDISNLLDQLFTSPATESSK